MLTLAGMFALAPRATVVLAAPAQVQTRVSVPAAEVTAASSVTRPVEPTGRSTAARAEGSVIFFCCPRTCNQPFGGCSERKQEAPSSLVPAGTIVGSCAKHAKNNDRRCLEAGDVLYRTTAAARISPTRERCGFPIFLLFIVAEECHLRSLEVPIVALEAGDDANHAGEHYVEYTEVKQLDGVNVYTANLKSITGGRDAGVPLVRVPDVEAARRAAREAATTAIRDRTERAAARKGFDGTIMLDREVTIRDGQAWNAVDCYSCSTPSVTARVNARAAAFSVRALEDRALEQLEPLLPEAHAIVEGSLRPEEPVLRRGRIEATVTATVELIGIEDGPALARGKSPAAAARALADRYDTTVIAIRRTYAFLGFLPLRASRIDVVVES
ncbi:MAG TPA: hypothetical protein VGB83_03165 [Actinomycetota bacterium]